MQRLPEKIRTLRERQGLSQGELANQVGVSRTHINKLESGSKSPSTKLMLKLADVFGTTIDALMRDEIDLEA